jgi:hypothetical protein
MHDQANVPSGLVGDHDVVATSSTSIGRPGTGGTSTSHGSVHEPAFAYHSSPLMPANVNVAHSDHSSGSIAAAMRMGSPLPPATRPSTGSGGKSDEDDASYVGSGSGRKAGARGKEAPKRTGKLPNSTTAILKDWLMLHVHHPYPTE